VPVQAQDLPPDLSRWNAYDWAMHPLGKGLPALPQPSPSFGSSGATSRHGDWAAPWSDPFQSPPASRPGGQGRAADTPDLSGVWRGSAGETVDIRGNRARIWGSEALACDCAFLLVGHRLIAYSPRTDTVRKYWFQGGPDQFRLLDEDGNLLSFQRVR
jgi:hypothetical protein